MEQHTKTAEEANTQYLGSWKSSRNQMKSTKDEADKTKNIDLQIEIRDKMMSRRC